MGYGAILSAVLGIVGTAMASNQADKARGGFEAQMNKWKKLDIEQLGDPKLVDQNSWQNVAASVVTRQTSPKATAERNKYATGQNKFMVDEAEKQYQAIQPRYNELQDQIGKNALGFAKGELPQDVVDSIGRAAAERGLQGGFATRGAAAGSAMSNLNLRNLGLTSLQLSQYGQDAMVKANQLTKFLSPELYDPSQLMLNPNMAAGLAAGIEQFNVGNQNDFLIKNNQLLNSERLYNTDMANSINQLIATNNYSNRMTKAAMYQQAGSSAGSALGGGGGGSLV